VLAQSPALMVPTLIGHGMVPNGRGGSALRVASNSCSA
jgi:hypothetical protein